VIVYKDWSERGQSPDRHFAVYHGVFANNVDPFSQRRVQLRMPAALTDLALWNLPPGAGGAPIVPSLGSIVWVAFETGDPALPVRRGLAS
jgi:hypothetical protein